LRVELDVYPPVLVADLLARPEIPERRGHHATP
jgi:hypothetical protein